jgi:serine protease inhibitor
MYRDGELSMVVILPKKKKNLSATTLDQALAEVRQVNLEVALPKFKITEEFPLNDVLQELGIKDAFRPGVANFSGMDHRCHKWV